MKHQCPHSETCHGQPWFCIWLVWGSIIAVVGFVTYLMWLGGAFG